MNLLPCPFCGGEAKAYDDGEDCIAACNNSDCFVIPCVVGNATVAAAIVKWNTRKPVSETKGWISMKDRRPDGGVEVLTCSLIGRFVSIRNAKYVRMLWTEAQANNETCAITHWQPLPEPPQ